MVRDDLVDAVVQETELDPKEVDQALEIVFDTIVDAVAHGDTVRIKRFGKFYPKDYKSHEQTIPATGERVILPSRRMVGFRDHPSTKARVLKIFREIEALLAG